MTTGRGMAVAQGRPNFPFAIVEESGPMMTAHGELWGQYVTDATKQVEHILLHGDA